MLLLLLFFGKKRSKRIFLRKASALLTFLCILMLPVFGQQKAVTHPVCNGLFIGLSRTERLEAKTGENAECNQNMNTKRRNINGVYK